VGDTKLYGLDQPSRLEVYTPLRQEQTTAAYVLMKSRVDPAALSAAVRRVGAGIDRGQPMFDVQTMEQRAREALGIRRVALILFGMFSGLALALAGIGIYGVISYSVAQRTQEMGIRMALGAQPAEVLRLVMWQGGKMAGLGALIGIPMALVLTRMMTKLLFAIEPGDPATFAAIPVVLGAVALLACYAPARRTMRVDPVTALRHE
jgi:putative ABC transport system permease protein